MLFNRDGYEIIDQLVPEPCLNDMIEEIDRSHMLLNSAGIRNAEKKFSKIGAFVKQPYLLEKANQYLPDTARLVRTILFNKSFSNNWSVSWHQDKTITISKPFERPGWKCWSLKDGIAHVQPSRNLLEQMITFRIHLDDATPNNGGLKIFPASHKRGIMDQNEINQYIKSHTAVDCIAKRGDVLVMRPLLLHSSSKLKENTKRRVIHVEFCSYPLPSGITFT